MPRATSPSLNEGVAKVSVGFDVGQVLGAHLLPREVGQGVAAFELLKVLMRPLYAQQLDECPGGLFAENGLNQVRARPSTMTIKVFNPGHCRGRTADCGTAPVLRRGPACVGSASARIAAMQQVQPGEGGLCSCGLRFGPLIRCLVAQVRA